MADAFVAELVRQYPGQAGFRALDGAAADRLSDNSLAAARAREAPAQDRLGLRHTGFETLEPEPPGVPERAHQYMNGIDTHGCDPSLDLYGGGGIAAPISELGGFLTALFTGRVTGAVAVTEQSQGGAVFGAMAAVIRTLFPASR